MSAPPKPVALIILDGWGYREQTAANAIAAAHTPNWDKLWRENTHTLISGSGRCVGLPSGQMGNSEVGHLNMGAGRVVHQDLTRIDMAIANGEFNSNPVLVNTIKKTIAAGKAIHILGLVSAGGVHSQEKHIQALISLAAKLHATKIYVHAFLDGRDTPPRSALTSLDNINKTCQSLSCGQIVSIIGRYYAMDRDKRWERTQQAYNLITAGIAEYDAPDALTALQLAYARGENDEFVKATSIHASDSPPVTVTAGDAVIFMNFRADRARQLTHAFIDKNFVGFQRPSFLELSDFVTLTEYDSTFNVAVAFPPVRLKNILAEYLSRQGLRQLRIAETEKYAHVTFFFNGGIEIPYPGEDRVLIPSPHVATYDLKPEMSAPELTARLVQAIQNQQYDVIICNFANPDMVGHTGNFAATVKAIEAIDLCLGKIIAALQKIGGEALITSDHGNAELMFDDQTGQPHTAHTCEQVPLIYFGRKATVVKSNGILADIAPTLLYLMDLPIPSDMTGRPLFELQ